MNGHTLSGRTRGEALPEPLGACGADFFMEAIGKLARPPVLMNHGR
jgi:hypothetical protein